MAKRKQYTQESKLKKYGLSVQEYEDMKAKTANTCYICSAPPRKKALCIDHDHKQMKALKKAGKDIKYSVRGLLCWTCNRRLISNLGDRPDSVQLYMNASLYLSNYKQKFVATPFKASFKGSSKAIQPS